MIVTARTGRPVADLPDLERILPPGGDVSRTRCDDEVERFSQEGV